MTRCELVQMIGNPFTRGTLALLFLATSAVDLRAQSAPPAHVGLRAQGAQPSASDGGSAGTLVVVSGGAAEALLFDPASRRLLGRFPTGPDPREVALSPDGRYAYVTSYGWIPGIADPEAEGEGARYGAVAGSRFGLDSQGVTVFDLVQWRVHAVFSPGRYRNLAGIRVGEDGQRLWVTAEADSGIVELDARTGEVKMLWKTGGGDPNTLTVTRDSRRIFVANTGSASVTMIDRVTVVPQRIATGRGPRGLALSNDESELWVANSGDNTVSVISTRRLREVASFPSGGREPIRLQFHPGGHEVWISHRGSQELTVLDVASAAVLSHIPIEGEPRSIAFSDDGALAFVSVPRRHRVDLIDVATRAVIGSLDEVIAPTGLAWSGRGLARGDLGSPRR